MRIGIIIGAIVGAVIGYFLIKNLDLMVGEVVGALSIWMGHELLKLLESKRNYK